MNNPDLERLINALRQLFAAEFNRGAQSAINTMEQVLRKSFDTTEKQKPKQRKPRRGKR